MDDETSEEKRFDISEKGEIVLYEPDSSIQLEVRIEDETVWLTQAQMSVLFGTTRNNITLHIGNIFKEGELQKNAVCKDFLHTAADGKNHNTYRTDRLLRPHRPAPGAGCILRRADFRRVHLRGRLDQVRKKTNSADGQLHL